MTKMRLVVDNFDSFVESYSLFSTFYVTSGDFSFPAKGWTDLTSSVLDMWLDAFSCFLLGHYKHILLHFMDGDYQIELHWINKNTATAHFIKCNTALIQTDIDLQYFARQLLAAVGKISREFALYTDKPQIASLIEKAAKLKIIMAQGQGYGSSGT